LLVLFFVMRTFPFDRSIRTEELTITVEVMQWAPPRSSTFCTFLSLILFRLLCVFLRYCTRVLILLATGCYHSCSLFLSSLSMLFVVVVQFSLFFCLLFFMYVCMCVLFVSVFLCWHTHVCLINAKKKKESRILIFVEENRILKEQIYLHVIISMIDQNKKRIWKELEDI
jgi:hypothetical protein